MSRSSFSVAVTLCVFLMLGRPHEASATPVTLTLTSGWGFHDIGMTDPGALNFFAAMAAIGVTQGCTACASLSMTFDDEATADANNTLPILAGELVLGSQSFRLSGSVDPQFAGFVTLHGPTLSAGGFDYAPRNIEFRGDFGFHPFSTWPSALAAATTWPALNAFVVFTGPGYNIGFTYWKVTSVSVSEPSTLALMSAALLGLIVAHRRRRQ